MPAILNQPQNPNMLHKTKFRFILQRAPNVVYWSQSAKVPSVSLSVATQVTPFSNIAHPGGKTEFEAFSLTFKVDEDMTNYLEIFEWMTNLGFVSDFKGYGQIEQSGQKPVSDASLVLLTSKENGNISVTFKDLFPISLSELQFDITENDIRFLDVTAIFKYTSFSIERINNNS